MASFSLDDIRAAAEAKYGSCDIEVGNKTVSLRNPLRLSKPERTKLLGLQSSLNEDEADQEELLTEAIRTIAATGAQAKVLLDAVKGDLAMLVEVFTRYSEGTQAGEASASRD